MKNLPNQKNYDAKNEGNYHFLYMALNEENLKFIYNSAIVVVIQCKQKSLFDLSAASLNRNIDVTRITNDNIY
jgi:hypothetical protein